jgi:predicted permease
MSGITSRTSNVRDFRAQSRSFEGIAGFNAFFDQLSYNLSDGEPARLVGVNVTANFLDVLGVLPVVGRNFVEEEGHWGGFVDEDGGPRTIILTHALWIQRFGGDPSVVGRVLPLNDEPVTVVGVLPETFDFASVFTPTALVDFLLPWPISEGTDNWGNTTTMVARLQPGVTPEAAQAELEAIVAGLQEADPNRWGLAATVSGLQERISRPFRSGMLLLAAAAALVMLIVCVNLSNMLLAQSPRRRREMAIRQALGATRTRLVRQLLIESVLASLSGAVFGVVLAGAATRFVSTRSGLEIPMLSSISIDSMALAFTVAIAVIAGLAVGIVPALQVSEGREAEAFGGTTRAGSGSRGARRFRELLVVAEVAMACVLLVFGGLVVRSFQRVMDVELGFEPENAVAWQLATSREFDTLGEIVAFYDEMVTYVEAVPGVDAVGLVDALPLGTNRTWSTRVVDKVYEEDEGGESFYPHIVDHRYLQTMEIPLIEGRHFTRDDTGDSPMVIIVSESAARRMFPNGEAMGRSILFGSAGGGQAEVVGVVADVKHRALELDGDNEIYFAMAQLWAFNTVEMVVRTSLPAAGIAAPVGDAVHMVEAQMPTEDFRTLDSVVESSVSPRRFTLQLLVAFALSALFLAGVGIYGVLSYSVTERIPEIGIRMALGEPAEAVRRSVVGRTALLATIGVAIGCGVSLAGTRLLGSLLYGVDPTDPLTFAGVIAVLMLVAFVSGLLPAIRASRTDPATALRSAG